MWCRKFGFQISMSRKGTPLDNAVIESFHARLKNEVVYNKEFKNIDELKQAIFDWIWFYNHGRIKGKRKPLNISITKKSMVKINKLNKIDPILLNLCYNSIRRNLYE